MKTLLVIAVLIIDPISGNGAPVTPVTQHAYVIQDAKCEYVRDHPSVVGSWKDIFGPDTILYCVEE